MCPGEGVRGKGAVNTRAKRVVCGLTYEEVRQVHIVLCIVCAQAGQQVADGQAHADRQQHLLLQTGGGRHTHTHQVIQHRHTGATSSHTVLTPGRVCVYVQD